MTNDNIRNLLERFMEGETSLEEEQRIARWFNDHPQVDADLENYRLMFAYFDEGMPRKRLTRTAMPSGTWPWRPPPRWRSS